MKFIEEKYGHILKLLERRDMTLEKYAYRKVYPWFHLRDVQWYAGIRPPSLAVDFVRKGVLFPHFPLSKGFQF